MKTESQPSIDKKINLIDRSIGLYEDAVRQTFRFLLLKTSSKIAIQVVLILSVAILVFPYLDIRGQIFTSLALLVVTFISTNELSHKIAKYIQSRGMLIESGQNLRVQLDLAKERAEYVYQVENQMERLFKSIKEISSE